MSEEIKYEPVFKLRLAEEYRHNACEAVVDFLGGNIPHYACASIIVRMHGETEDDHRRVELAERMVNGMNNEFRKAIAPTWTKADQQTGKLPDVGCECRHCQSKLVKSVIAVTATHIVIDANNGVGVAPDVLRHDEFMQYYIPIETPDERAARLRGEWVYFVQNEWDKAGAKGGFLEFIYDLQAAGELPPVQAKDGA